MGYPFSRLHKPVCYMCLDASQPCGVNFTYRAQQYPALNYCKAPDTNNTGNFQARSGKVWVVCLDDLVKPWDVAARLGRDHTYKPILIWAWQLAKQQGRTQPPLCQISLWESEQHDLACTFHENTTFKSAVV